MQLTKDSLNKTAVSMARSVHNLSIFRKFVEVEANKRDDSIQVQIEFVKSHLEREPYRIAEFREFVRQLGPKDLQQFKLRSYAALAGVEFVHKTRLYFANIKPLLLIATPVWLGVSWADNFNNTWELGALIFVATAVVGYRALQRDPYYGVGAQARKTMDSIFAGE
ncbi:MAG: hypothetical protein QXU54_03630 [Candidatus Micrarchaeia archaeon]